MARLGRLSNDELAGEEETVMATMSFLGELMSVMDGNFNVGGADWLFDPRRCTFLWQAVVVRKFG